MSNDDENDNYESSSLCVYIYICDGIIKILIEHENSEREDGNNRQRIWLIGVH